MTLDPKRVQSIFWEAVQFSDPADRAIILERECSADPELWRRVAALLKAHDEYNSLLNEPTFILPSWALGSIEEPDDGVEWETTDGRATPDPATIASGGRNGLLADGDSRNGGVGPG